MCPHFVPSFLHSTLDYSGSIRVRMPKTLHRDLATAAELEGVSLNQYMLYKLSK
ncbi:toxin-antitoxin system HicB family antitoxin [Paenibacillus tyrfis]|uniref:toxin-antitoxin system HicB family antitoxin n=1 Tax=Paenibacillus tyrfis TaxID=1501230 RepID=UPI002E13FB5A